MVKDVTPLKLPVPADNAAIVPSEVILGYAAVPIVVNSGSGMLELILDDVANGPLASIANKLVDNSNIDNSFKNILFIVISP